MDRDLLEALNDIGIGLERVAQALDARKGRQDRSSIEETLVSGEFEEKLTRIAEGVDQIKVKTDKILSNQETIIKLQKDQQGSKMGPMAISPTDSGVKDGITTIGLIAGSIIATGIAFKLLDGVNWKSILSVSISLPLMAFTYKKIGLSGMTPASALSISGVVGAMSLGVVGASKILSHMEEVSPSKLLTALALTGAFYVLLPMIGKMISSITRGGEMTMPNGQKVVMGAMSMAAMIGGLVTLPFLMATTALAISKASANLGDVKEISNTKLLTVIGISLAFGAASFGIAKFLSSMSGLGIMALGATVVALPHIMSQFALGVKESSGHLNDVTEVNIGKMPTILMIAASFGLMGFGIGSMVKSLSGASPASIATAMLLSPVVYGMMSYAIKESSKYLSEVDGSMTLQQGLTSIFISAMFVVLSYAIGPMVRGVRGATIKDVAMGAGSMVIMAGAVAAATEYLSKSDEISPMKVLGFTLLGLGLLAVSVPFSMTARLMSRVSLTDIVKGGVAIVGISGVIALSSRILSLGDYSEDKYPSLDWALGTGASVLGFGVSMVLLGALISTGVGAVVLGAGAAGILGVSSTIAAASHILAAGIYSEGKYPSMEWIKGVAASGSMFAGSMVLLGGIILTGVGAAALYAGNKGMVGISKTVVEVSGILNKGTYDSYPSLDWVDGVSNSILKIAGLLRKIGRVSSKEIGMMRHMVSSIIGIDSILTKGKFDTLLSSEWVDGVVDMSEKFLTLYKNSIKEMGMFDMIQMSIKMRMLSNIVVDTQQRIMEIPQGVVGDQNGVLSVIESYFRLMTDDRWSMIAPSYMIRRTVRDVVWMSSEIQKISPVGNSVFLMSGMVNVLESLSEFVSKIPGDDWSSRFRSLFRVFRELRTDTMSFFDGLRMNIQLNVIENITNRLSRISVVDIPVDMFSGLSTLFESFKGMSDNVMGMDDFTNISKQLDMVEDIMQRVQNMGRKNNVSFSFKGMFGGGGMSGFNESLGGIEMMVRSFDRLSKSMGSFANSMEKIQLDKLESIRTLSSNMVFFSMMDVEQFNRVMSGIEAKSGVFAGLIRDVNTSPAAGVISSGAISSGDQSGTTVVDMGEVVGRLDAAIGLLSQLVATVAPMKTHMMMKKDKQLTV